MSDTPITKPATESLGDLLNTLRRAKEVTQAEVADVIGRSISFYSAIEVGRKPAPPDILHKIILFLKPTRDEHREINRLAARMQKEIRIPVSELRDAYAETAMLLARRLPEMSESQLNRLKAVLESKD